MQKILILFIIASSLSRSITHAQEYTVEIGSEMKEDVTYIFGDFLHFTNDGLYTYYQRRDIERNAFFLEKYDYNFNLIFSKKQSIGIQNYRTHGALYSGKHFLWLTSKYQRSENELQIYLSQISMEGISETPSLIASVNLQKNREPPKVEWKYSPDSSKIVILTNTYTNHMETNFVENIFVLNEEYAVIKHVVVDHNYSSKKMEVEDFIITNKGSIYIANRKFLTNRDRRSDYKYFYLKNKDLLGAVQVYYISPEDKSPKEIEVLNKGYRINSLKFAIDQEENVLIAGLYGESKVAGSTGTFLTRLTRDNSLIFLKQNDLPSQFTTDINKDNLHKNDNKLLWTNLVNTKDIELMENGNMYIIQEGSYSNVKTSKSSEITYNNFSTTEKFITEYDGEGNILDNHVVFQNLTYQKPDFTSYFSINTGKELKMLYNDNESNIKNNIHAYPKTEILGTTIKIAAVIASFGQTSEQKRTIVSTRKELESVLAPQNCRLNGNQVYFISKNISGVAINKQKYYLGKIEVK